MCWHVRVWSDLAVALRLNCTGRVIKSSFLIKNPLLQTTSRKSESSFLRIYTFIYFCYFSIADVISTNFFLSDFGTCMQFESNISHVLAVTGTLIGDCFTQIRWELSFAKECLSLTITVISSLWPQCECRMSTCISQILWFKKQTSALREK